MDAQMAKDGSGVNRVTCEVCDKSFTNGSNLARHRKSHDDPETRKLACSACTKVYLTKGGLNEHIRKAHNVHENGKPFSCTYCEKRFWSNDKLYSHTSVHTGERPFPCPQCTLRFRHNSNLTQHVRTVHRAIEEPSSSCLEPGCGKQFKAPQYLNQHMKRHSAIPPTYPCPTCSKLYNSIHGLAAHVKSYHAGGEKRHVCTYCDKRFHSNGELLRHVRGHTGEKPYGCALCPRRFVDKGGLRTHETSFHGDARHYGCPQCGYRFKSRCTLNRHMETHKSEVEKRMSACNECGKMLLGKDGLKRHMAVHLKRDEYQQSCPICDKKFANTARLGQHVMIHTGEKPHVCCECGKSFKSTSTFRRHERNVHMETNPSNWRNCN